MTSFDRRQFLRAIGASATGTVIYGCAGDGGSTTGGLTDPNEATEIAGESGSGQAGSPSAPGVSPEPIPPGRIKPFGLLSRVGGSDLPFAFGHVFRQGDVPKGSYLDSDLVDWQATPVTTWPDGSLKHAIIAGRVTCQPNELQQIGLTASPTNRGGANLSESDLVSTLSAVTLECGTETIALNALIGTAAKHRTVASGPIMSNWLYRKQLAGSNHLVAWFDVRLYKGGTVEILPWIENGYFLVAGPTNDMRAYTLNIGGMQVFSATIDVKHHTKVPLLNGDLSYWSADPEITPVHDISYLMATGMVPTYAMLTPSEAKLNSLVQDYTPNTLAGADPAMGSAGNQGSIIGSTQAFYLTTNCDVRAYKAMITFGLSSGAWPIHYRDHTTNETFSYQDYPTASLSIQNSPTVPVGSGGTVNGLAPAHSHLTSYGYLPWLMTGRWYFMEECVSWCDYIYLNATVDQRMGPLTSSGTSFIMDPCRGNGANRGAHWAMARIAQALAVVPDSGYANKRADLVNAWEKNCDFYEAKFVLGTETSGGNWVSPQGFLGDFAEGGNSLYHSRIEASNGAWGPGGGRDPGNHWWGAAWMSAFACHAWGHASDIGLPISSEARTKMLAVRDHAYKQVVQRADDGHEGRYNWRRFVMYEYPIGDDETGLPPETWLTASESYAIYETVGGLGPVPATEGLGILERYSDVDMLPSTAALYYTGQQVGALAFARTHAVPGAIDAWRRISTASNFSAVLESEYVANSPELAIRPRM